MLEAVTMPVVAELQTILDFLRPGDALMVTRIDRLARSIGDLQDIVRAVRAKGATLKATEQPFDTGTAAGKCFLDMLGVFAEFETNLRKERQMEGIAKAKAAGVYKGRPASIDPAQVQQLKAQGMGPSQIAKHLGIARASVYRALERVTDAYSGDSDSASLLRPAISTGTPRRNRGIETVGRQPSSAPTAWVCCT